MITLTKDNYIGIAMHYYDNIQCNSIEEFDSDLNKIRCIKKLIDKYIFSKKVNIRLLLNHVILLHNVFSDICCELLKLRLEEKHYPVIKSIMVYLKYIDSNEWNAVQEDVKMLNYLRTI